jgi:hypothetical protein
LSTIVCRVIGSGCSLRQEALDRVLRQGRQQHAAVRRAVGRHARARLQRRRHQPPGADRRHAHQLVVVEHADRGRLAQRIRQPVQRRLGDARQARRMQVGLAQAQHRRRQREQLVLVAHVAEVGQRDQVAARGGARQAGGLGHFGDRQARALLVEGFDHLQALFEAADEVALQRRFGFFAHSQIDRCFVRVSHKVRA